MLKLEAKITVEEAGRGKRTVRNDILQGPAGATVDFNELLEWQRKALIQVAKIALVEEQAKGFTKDPLTIVDGKTNKPVEAVKPFGKIIFQDAAKFLNKDVVIDTFQQIIRRSPILSGQYINSHYVFLNGQVVASSLTELETWINTNPVLKSGDLLRFVNVAPYARKLERWGVTSSARRSTRYVKSRDRQQRSGAKVLTPNGVYYLTYRSVSRKYKGVKNVKFALISGESFGKFGAIDFGARGRRYTSKQNLRGRKERQAGVGRTYLYPSITIRF